MSKADFLKALQKLDPNTDEKALEKAWTKKAKVVGDVMDVDAFFR